MTQVCEKLGVRSDGTLASAGCFHTDEYLDPPRLPPW